MALPGYFLEDPLDDASADTKFLANLEDAITFGPQDTLRFRCRAACFGVSKIGVVTGRLGTDRPVGPEFLESIGVILGLERPC